MGLNWLKEGNPPQKKAVAVEESKKPKAKIEEKTPQSVEDPEDLDAYLN